MQAEDVGPQLEALAGCFLVGFDLPYPMPERGTVARMVLHAGYRRYRTLEIYRENSGLWAATRPGKPKHPWVRIYPGAVVQRVQLLEQDIAGPVEIVDIYTTKGTFTLALGDQANLILPRG